MWLGWSYSWTAVPALFDICGARPQVNKNSLLGQQHPAHLERPGGIPRVEHSISGKLFYQRAILDANPSYRDRNSQ